MKLKLEFDRSSAVEGPTREKHSRRLSTCKNTNYVFCTANIAGQSISHLILYSMNVANIKIILLKSQNPSCELTRYFLFRTHPANGRTISLHREVSTIDICPQLFQCPDHRKALQLIRDSPSLRERLAKTTGRGPSLLSCDIAAPRLAPLASAWIVTSKLSSKCASTGAYVKHLTRRFFASFCSGPQDKVDRFLSKECNGAA